MSKHPQFPTPIQEIALNLTFAVMGERRFTEPTMSPWPSLPDYPRSKC